MPETCRVVYNNKLLHQVGISRHGLFSLCFPTKTLYTPLLSPIRPTSRALLIPLDLITRIMSLSTVRLNYSLGFLEA